MLKASTTSLVSGSPRTPTAGTADDTSSRRAAASPRHAGTPRARRSHRWRRERTRVKKTWSHWHVSTAVCHIWINMFCLLLSPEYGKHICPLVQQTTHKTTCNTLFCHLYPTDNIPEQSTSSSESELKKEVPVIPPRPSPELILERCSDNTRKKVSIRSRTSSAT